MFIERSDLIALISALLAALAALYARWSVNQARRSNEIAMMAEQKPRRLSVYASLRDFLHFCSTYRTMQCMKMVEGTHDLVARIDSFKWEIKQHGPLDMPEIVTLAEDARANAWQLQRLLDSLPGLDARRIEQVSETTDNDIAAILEWFATKEKMLEGLFEPYLRIT